MKKIAWIAAACLLAGVPAVSFGDLITNGSFETPSAGVSLPDADTFRKLTAINSDIAGWTIEGGSVDWIRENYWQAADGQMSLDMSGTESGLMKIGQTVTLDVGQTYRLSFDLAGNPNGGPATKTLGVMINNGFNFRSFEFTNSSATTNANMGWTTMTWEFEATQASNTFWFMSQTPGNAGPALDNVSLVAVPAPGAALLIGLGLAGIGWIKRRIA